MNDYLLQVSKSQSLNNNSAFSYWQTVFLDTSLKVRTMSYAGVDLYEDRYFSFILIFYMPTYQKPEFGFFWLFFLFFQTL